MSFISNEGPSKMEFTDANQERLRKVSYAKFLEFTVL